MPTVYEPGLAGGVRWSRYGAAMSRRSIPCVAGIVVISLTGCGGRSQDCTAVGFTSYVGVALPSTGWSVREFCVDDECQDAVTLSQGNAFRHVDDEPREYDVRLTVADPDGRSFTMNQPVGTQPYRVNGPGCDPLTANALITVSPDGAFDVGPPAG